MSEIGKINRFFRNLPQPSVKLLYCGYAENYSPGFWYHPNRMSPFWRFYWGATDGANLVFSNCRLALDSQSVVFVPPDIPFGTEADKPFSQLFIHFDWAGGPSLSEPVIFPAAEEWNLLHSSQTWYETSSESVAQHMYSLLFRYLPRFRELESKRSKKVDSRIERALLLLDTAERDISLMEIAKEISMSYYHFLDTFKKQVGIPPGQYKMTQRMNYAQFLLLSTDEPIKDIARKTGFTNRFHFSKTFKLFFKQSPGEYRKSRDSSQTRRESMMEYTGKTCDGKWQ